MATSTIVDPADHCQDPPRSWIVRESYDYRTWIGTCPHAQTMLGHCPEFRCTFVIPLPCKQWGCRFCSANMCRRLAAKTRDAKPNRMLTLTIDPSLWGTPRAAFDATRRKLPIFIAYLRKKFGPIEYLRVTELTRAGWPHYHLLVRSGFLPHPVLAKKWRELTGARIVDIRQVLPRWNAYTYLLKYLTKLSSIEWTERHVSFSKQFFPEEQRPSGPPLPMEKTETISMHPNTYLRENEVGSFVARLTPRIMAVSPLLENLENLLHGHFADRTER